MVTGSTMQSTPTALGTCPFFGVSRKGEYSQLLNQLRGAGICKYVLGSALGLCLISLRVVTMPITRCQTTVTTNAMAKGMSKSELDPDLL